ncbi:MAG: peroxiredoxin [Negativicutes bacterium]|nr:peroxiredoxin [Negativicutes bacterium]
MDSVPGHGMPLIGDRFPEIEATTTHGSVSLPRHFAGKWFILFSHPADFTPVCTTELAAFACRHGEFRRMNTELIGLSVDQVGAHLKWIEWMDNHLEVDIRFPIIADGAAVIARRLGMLHTQSATSTVRAVFIVDNHSIIRAILYYPQETGRHTGEVLRLLHALQTVDQYGVATPANWPHNSLIGDDVIVPPAKTEKAAVAMLDKAQKGEVGCYDWWFCHYALRSEDPEEDYCISGALRGSRPCPMRRRYMRK